MVSGARPSSIPERPSCRAKRVTDRVGPLLERTAPADPDRSGEPGPVQRRRAARRRAVAGHRARDPAGRRRAGRHAGADDGRRSSLLDRRRSGASGRPAPDPLSEEPRPVRRAAARGGRHRGPAQPAAGGPVTAVGRLASTSVRRAVRTARRDARIAVRSATTARRLPG